MGNDWQDALPASWWRIERKAKDSWQTLDQEDSTNSAYDGTCQSVEG